MAVLVWGLTILSVGCFALGALNWFVWKRREPALLFGRPDRILWAAIAAGAVAQGLVIAGYG